VFFYPALGSQDLEARVDCSGRHLTPAGNRGKVETPQTGRRGGSTSSPGNLVSGAKRNGPRFHTTNCLNYFLLRRDTIFAIRAK
jgi:hypothetical protein